MVSPTLKFSGWYLYVFIYLSLEWGHSRANHHEGIWFSL